MPHLFMYCIMHHASFIYVFIMSRVFVLSLILTHFLTLGRMEHQYLLLEEEYDKGHRAWYIEEEWQVT
jgi:hypothetical protein